MEVHSNYVGHVDSFNSQRFFFLTKTNCCIYRLKFKSLFWACFIALSGTVYSVPVCAVVVVLLNMIEVSKQS